MKQVKEIVFVWTESSPGPFPDAKRIHSLTKNRVRNQNYLAGKGKKKKLTRMNQGDLKRKGGVTSGQYFRLGSKFQQQLLFKNRKILYIETIP